MYYKVTGKMTVLAVRLDSESEALLEELVRETGHTKSELVREALTDLSRRKSRKKPGVRPYDLMKEGIGIWRSGGLNLSERTGDKFYEMLVEDRKRKEREQAKGDRQPRDPDRRRTASRTARRG